MSAWKSSEGGSITQVGGSSFTAANGAGQTIVSAVANVRGVSLKTIAMRTTGGSSKLYVNGTLVLGISSPSTNGGESQFVRDIFVPAGVAVTCDNDIYGQLAVTYNIH